MPNLITATAMPCPHLDSLCTQQGLQQIYRAAEWVFSSTYRPILGIGEHAVPRCLHPHCPYTACSDIYVCINCIYVACTAPIPPGTHHSTSENHHLPRTHLYAHYQESGHSTFLSVEHAHLFCVICNDFVYNRFLDPALELQAHRARAHRRSFTSTMSPLKLPLHPRMLATPSISKTRANKQRLVTRKGWTPTSGELVVMSKRALPLPALKDAVRPPPGLFNLGNSCYMNSVLQAFLNAPPLRNYFLANEHRPNCTGEHKFDCFACALDQLVCDSCFTAEGAKKPSSSNLEFPFLVPRNVLDIVWRNAEHLATYTQQDAHEFLIAALDLLNNHCRGASSPKRSGKPEQLTSGVKVKKEVDLISKPNAEGKRALSPVSPAANMRANPLGTFTGAPQVAGPRPSSNNIVQSLFSGTLQSDVICRVCGSSSPTLEKFHDISLDVDKIVKPSSSRRSRAQSPAVDRSSDDSRPSYGVNNARSTNFDERTRGKGKDDQRSHGVDSPHLVDGGKHLGDGTNGSWDGDRNKELDSSNTLDECLSRFTEPELLESDSKMFCSNCASCQEAMKQMSIHTLPPIVCFHFKRFERSFASIRRSEMVKIDTPVAFPADCLDLSSFQTSAVLRRRNAAKLSTPENIVDTSLAINGDNKTSRRNGSIAQEKDFSPPRATEESLYDLFAVVNHVGKIDSGHYTAMVRREGHWFRCDDEKVSRLKDVGKVIRSEAAYLVFYVQRYPNFQYV
eukprot:GFKZ01003521.1.p1 GENE.GFKZ01003521.1~~GFKZ01003521.1.p1  ORF type:complete len:735 (-),score=68.27 GFKZ01003521.1:1591-3795(-)